MSIQTAGRAGTLPHETGGGEEEEQEADKKAGPEHPHPAGCARYIIEKEQKKGGDSGPYPQHVGSPSSLSSRIASRLYHSDMA